MEEHAVRINKYLADAGICSRREADRMIEGGRVRIDGVRAVLGDVVAPGSTVLVDGAPVHTRGKKVYIALNKPVGIVCTADPREKANIVDFIGHKERIYPIGRLDKDSQDKPITGEFLRAMESGVPILDTVTLPCKIRKTGERRFTLILVQGLNRQIRRMCEHLGYRVVRLKRVRIMNVRLGNLKSGHWRNLTARELQELLRAL